MKPLVVCIMLTRDRPEMARRAIECFRSQTYERKMLLIVDSGERACVRLEDIDQKDGVIYYREYVLSACTIGAIRNWANQTAKNLLSPDLIAHWDDDDWSDPNRLAEQVALLQASGKQCVGYRELLFWDTREACPPDCEEEFGHTEHSSGEAWLYRNPDPRWVAGTSMLYTRQAWESCHFDDAPHEDQRWWLANAEKCMGVSSVEAGGHFVDDPSKTPINMPIPPRMIAHIHGGNTEQISRDVMQRGGGGVWRRAPEFDSYCEEKMRL